jgi:hypothetical protein
MANATEQALDSTKNDLPENTRVEVVGLLSQRLADCINLQLQTKGVAVVRRGPSTVGMNIGMGASWVI